MKKYIAMNKMEKVLPFCWPYSEPDYKNSFGIKVFTNKAKNGNIFSGS